MFSTILDDVILINGGTKLQIVGHKRIKNG